MLEPFQLKVPTEGGRSQVFFGVTRSNVSAEGPLLGGGVFFWVLDLAEHIADQGPLLVGFSMQLGEL